MSVRPVSTNDAVVRDTPAIRATSINRTLAGGPDELSAVMTLASRRKRALSVSGRCKSSRQRGPQGRHNRPQAGCRDQQFPANAHSGAVSTGAARALTHRKDRPGLDGGVPSCGSP